MNNINFERIQSARSWEVQAPKLYRYNNLLCTVGLHTHMQ